MSGTWECKICNKEFKDKDDEIEERNAGTSTDDLVKRMRSKFTRK